MLPSTVDGVCDLQCGPGGREVSGVDDLRLVVQPGSGRLGIGLEVLETEQGVAKRCVPLDAPAEGVLVSAEDEMPWNLP